MIFTNTDKALLLRVCRLLLADAGKLEKQHGTNWVASPDAKAAKAEFDRLHRDVRDVKALVKRLEAETGPLVKKGSQGSALVPVEPQKLEGEQHAQ